MELTRRLPETRLPFRTLLQAVFCHRPYSGLSSNKKLKPPQPCSKTLPSLPVWIKNLECNEDREFIINGMTNRFSLIDEPMDKIKSVFSKNHRSAFIYKDKVEKRIREEIEVQLCKNKWTIHASNVAYSSNTKIKRRRTIDSLSQFSSWWKLK